VTATGPAPTIERPLSPVLRTGSGAAVPMAVDRWFDDASPGDHGLLGRVLAPVIDLGCGPGRHVAALAEVGVPVLGVDISPHALALARERGALVLERSIFDPLPGTGRWGTALLLDGNIGIGGDPARLLARTAELLGPTGRLLVEVGPPGSGSSRLTVCVEAGERRSPWFPWALVDVEAISDLARRAPAARGIGWELDSVWTDEDRWFAQLDRVVLSRARRRPNLAEPRSA